MSLSIWRFWISGSISLTPIGPDTIRRKLAPFAARRAATCQGSRRRPRLRRQDHRRDGAPARRRAPHSDPARPQGSAFGRSRALWQRNLIERFFCKLKHFRRIATRFDKLARNFLAAVLIASTRLWLRAYESTT
ncbi:transposase [Tardiphaga sp. vice352]|nr:transposase [Tardiphaga sp. vice278]QDM29563.1 transposase [Tardiphaga sp. vice304]QDM34668.1 transposase [Tardiphaga sp. vice352]